MSLVFRTLPIIFSVLFLPLETHAVRWEDVIREAATAEGLCADFLRTGPYQPSTMFLNAAPIPTLIAEPGSIENLDPGVVGDLVRLRMQLIAIRRSLDPQAHVGYADAVDLVATRLKSMSSVGADVRLRSLIDDFSIALSAKTNALKLSGATLNKQVVTMFINQLTASLWELTVACLFDGRHIYLNRTLSRLYPERFAALPEKLRRSASGINREIDVAVMNEDGSSRWIEVKDWDLKSALNSESQGKIFVQSHGQRNAQKTLNLSASTILVLKFGLPAVDYLHYRMGTDYDQILFVFPAGLN